MTAASDPGPAAVEVESVSRRFDAPRAVFALRDVSLCVGRGERVALVGPSGAGKSTLLNLLGTLDRPTTGTVRIDGVDLARLDDDDLARLRRDRIGFVFQFFNLLPTLTALENAALPLRLAGATARDASARARELLAAVGLDERRDHLPEQLSGGEQQRVAIARALCRGPALVLADEPTGNLDSAAGRGVLALLADLATRHGAAVVLATHSAEVAVTADRTLHLLDGRLVPGAGQR